jgi:hypothetical protein
MVLFHQFKKGTLVLILADWHQPADIWPACVRLGET